MSFYKNLFSKMKYHLSSGEYGVRQNKRVERWESSEEGKQHAAQTAQRLSTKPKGVYKKGKDIVSSIYRKIKSFR